MLAFPAGAVELRLIIGGTPGLKLEGECTVVGAKGGIEHVRFKTQSPKTYEIEGEAASCTLRKSDDFGRIMATMQQDGRPVARAETTVAYRRVEVRTTGPWGRASGFKGDAPMRLIPDPVPRQRAPIVIPPLKGPIPPPLIGRSG